jgi:hypothetical protein
MNEATAKKLNEALDAGKVVTVSTYTRHTPVKAKHRDAWRKAGFEFFKAGENGSLYMIAGQSKGRPRYDHIGFCRITVSA